MAAFGGLGLQGTPGALCAAPLTPSGSASSSSPATSLSKQRLFVVVHKVGLGGRGAALHAALRCMCWARRSGSPSFWPVPSLGSRRSDQPARSCRRLLFRPDLLLPPCPCSLSPARSPLPSQPRTLPLPCPLQSVPEEALARLFRAFPGMEYCDLKRDRATGRSKGYCYVNYSSPDAAAAAQAQFNGMEFPAGTGYRLKVGAPRRRWLRWRVVSKRGRQGEAGRWCGGCRAWVRTQQAGVCSAAERGAEGLAARARS